MLKYSRCKKVVSNGYKSCRESTSIGQQQESYGKNEVPLAVFIIHDDIFVSDSSVNLAPAKFLPSSTDVRSSLQTTSPSSHDSRQSFQDHMDI